MNYYQVSVSAEPKIIGVKNGVYQVEIIEDSIEKNENYKNFLAHFDYYNKDFWKTQDNAWQLQPPVIKGKLLKKAKLTDIMGYAPEYHCLYDIYSQKYIDIIKTFNIGNYNTFDFEIETVKEKYFLLFYETITLDNIIYEKSSVITGHKVLNNIKYFSVSNENEYREFNQKNPLGGFEKIAISKEYLGRDIISVQATSKPFYSERLIDFLLDCGITGLQVKYNNSIQLEFV